MLLLPLLLVVLPVTETLGHGLHIQPNRWLRVRRNTQEVISGNNSESPLKKEEPLDDDIGLIPEKVLAKLFEGDIVPDFEGIAEEYGVEVAQSLANKGIIQPITRDIRDDRRWSTRVNGVVQIPYAIDAGAGYSSSQIATIVNALDQLSLNTKVLKYVPHTTETKYIEVTSDPDRGCSSFVGNVFSGMQPLWLRQNGCVYTGIVQHEFLHSLGFWHEQSRPDRDDYVQINLDNVIDGFEDNFLKQEGSTTLESEYDYGSVMHYGRTYFSSNGGETVTPLDNNAVIGQRVGASEEDIRQVQLLYQCISGPRTVSEAEANPCTADCKCWNRAFGCGNDDNLCQGNFPCVNDRCGCDADDNLCPINEVCLNDACVCSNDQACDTGNVCMNNQCVCNSNEGCDPGYECIDNECVIQIGDECNDAVAIGLGTIPGTTSGASNTAVPFCDTTKTAPEVWYSVVGTGDNMVAETCGFNGYDTKIFVLEGGCTNLSCVAGNDDSCGGLQSKVQWPAVSGVVYFVVVHGFDGATGSFELSISNFPLPSAQPSTQPSTQPTQFPTDIPSSCPSMIPSSNPSSPPSIAPSGTHSAPPTNTEVSPAPSLKPSASPTFRSKEPSLAPSLPPTGYPSGQPSSPPASVTNNPSTVPSLEPTVKPSVNPSSPPTKTQTSPSPSANPSSSPSFATGFPSILPSVVPTGIPSTSPSSPPTKTAASPSPSMEPSSPPTFATSKPSLVRSAVPTETPSASPSSPPTKTAASPSPSTEPSSPPTFATSAPSLLPSVVPTGTPTRASSKPSSFLSTSPSAEPIASPIATPGPTPSRLPDLSCLSGENIVEVTGKGIISLENLELGDSVRTSDGLFSQVYSFAHRDPMADASFIRLVTMGSSTVVELSRDHYIFLNGQYSPASLAKPGDSLASDQNTHAWTIQSVSKVQRKGLYAPLTMTGDLLINNTVVVSNYVQVFDSSVLDQHTMMHMFLAPLRGACRWAPDWCHQETYRDGISSRLYTLSKVFQWIRRGHRTWQYMTSAVVLPAASLFWMTERLLVTMFRLL